MTLSELKDKRTETSKTYQLHGGRYRTVWASLPIHVRVNGAWEEISLDREIGEDGVITYTRLPYQCQTDGNWLELSDRAGEYGLVMTVDQPRARFLVGLEEVKPIMVMKSPAEVPARITTSIKYFGLSPVIGPETIDFWQGDRKVWTLKGPTILDGLGAWSPIKIKIGTPDPYLTLEIEAELPRAWLEDPHRAWPLIYDPTQTYSSDLLTNGCSRSHTTPGGIVITAGTSKCKWKGVSVYVPGQEQRQATRTSSNSATGTGLWVTCYTSISLGSGETFVSAYKRTTMSNLSSVTMYNVYIDGSLYCSSVAPSGSCGPKTTNLSVGQLGSQSHQVSGESGYTIKSTGYSSLTYNYWYYYQTEYKTQNPKVTISQTGKVTQYSGSINNGSWTSLANMTAGSLVVGLNTMNFNIGGSGKAYYYMQYDYTLARPTPLKTIKVQLGSGLQTLPLVSLTDPALENGSILRVADEGVVYAVDLVATSNSEASTARIATHKGILAWRKYL